MPTILFSTFAPIHALLLSRSAPYCFRFFISLSLSLNFFVSKIKNEFLKCLPHQHGDVFNSCFYLILFNLCTVFFSFCKHFLHCLKVKILLHILYTFPLESDSGNTKGRKENRSKTFQFTLFFGYKGMQFICMKKKKEKEKKENNACLLI